MPSPELFQSGELVIEVQAAPDLMRLDWRGRSLGRRPDETLTPYLTNIVDRARESAAGIEMHFEALEFFNSSTVAVLVQILEKARRAGVRLSLMYRPSVRWQQLSFEALRVFEQRDQTVQVIPLPAA